MVLESKEIVVCGVFCVFLRAGLCLVLPLGHAYHIRCCSAAWPSACWQHFPLVHWDEWKKLKYLALSFYSSPSFFPLHLLGNAINLRLGR